jgi:transposase
MRYELTDHEWMAIKPMLPNKPRGVPRVNDRRVLNGRKGALANIPPRCNRSEPICFSPYLYRARNLVERFFNKIKHCRRVCPCSNHTPKSNLQPREQYSVREVAARRGNRRRDDGYHSAPCHSKRRA